MRILHAIRSDGYGGVESYVATLASTQLLAGHDVMIIGGDLERMSKEANLAPGKVIAARTASEVAREVRRAFITRKPDVVHAHMTAAEIGAAVSLLGRSTPLVVTRHFASRRGTRRAVRLLAPLLARRISAQIAVSQYVADAVEGDSVIVRPGVPVADGAKAVAKGVPAPRSRTVLVVQRLEAEKRGADALRIFAASRVQDQGWRLVFAGDGAQRGALERLAAELGVTSVDFLGHRTDVPALLDDAGILLAPCDVETFGLAVVEAMAHRLPVVGAAAAGHLETVGTVENSALYAVDDLERAADLVRHLAEDEGAREAYGKRLERAQREHFTLDRQAEEIRRVYESVL